MLRIIDDGTLDTIVHCDQCGEIARYNTGEAEALAPEWPTEAELVRLDEQRRAYALELAEEDHIGCGRGWGING